MVSPLCGFQYNHITTKEGIAQVVIDFG